MRQLPSEARIQIDAGAHMKYMLKHTDGGEKEVLPWIEDPGNWNQLTIGMDSSAVGRGGRVREE